MSDLPPKDGVIGRRCCGQLKILGAALQADGETRSVDAASSIRRRSAAWTILRDWTFRSRTRASALWMARARSFGEVKVASEPDDDRSACPCRGLARRAGSAPAYFSVASRQPSLH